MYMHNVYRETHLDTCQRLLEEVCDDFRRGKHTRHPSLPRTLPPKTPAFLPTTILRQIHIHSTLCRPFTLPPLQTLQTLLDARQHR